MRILYDGGASQERGAGGIKRYFMNLISRLPEDFEPHLTTCRAPEETEPAHPRLRIHRFRRFRPQRVSLKLERAFFSRVANSHPFDIAHPTYYTLLTQDEISQYRCPVVITVWDMIHEMFPQLDPSGSFRALKQRAIVAADCVLCISEKTKEDMLTLYRVDPKKVIVTPLAADLDPTLGKESELTPSRPYFLYVGARPAYKNFDGLLTAFARTASLASDVALCAVGLPFSEAEAKQINELGLAGRVEVYSNVSDPQLAALYRNSLALVYPSLYEGFGIPPLEAMQCGTPVIASSCGSIPEVVGDAALLFDPVDSDGLVDILLSVIRNPTLRDDLISKGFQRVRLFTWEKTAKQTIDAYRSVSR